MTKKPATKKPKAWVAQSVEPAPSKPMVAGSSPAPRSKRKRIDWEAIERDYRTGKFTLKELEAKHGAGYADISRRAKREGWTKDLREAIKQATSAAVIAETTKAIANEAQKSQTQVVDTVLAAAELNKQVIMRHRNDVVSLRNSAMAMLAELDLTTHGADAITETFAKVTEDIGGPDLAAVQAQFRDFMRLHNRVGSVQKLADTLGKLQPLERRAYNLDDDGKGGGPTSWDDLVGDIAGDIGA